MAYQDIKFFLIVWFVAFTVIPLSALLLFFHKEEMVVLIILFSIFFASVLAVYLGGKILNSLKKDIPTEVKEEPAEEVIVWDEKSALHRFGDSTELLANTINIYVEDTTAQMEHLKKFIDTQNFIKIAQYAHNIKGSSANLSALAIWNMSSKIEKNAKEVKDIEKILLDYNLMMMQWQTTTDMLYKYLYENKSIESAILSDEDVLNSLSVLKSLIQDNEYIDTNTMDLFMADIHKDTKKKLKELKLEIDSFNFTKSIAIIDDIKRNRI